MQNSMVVLTFPVLDQKTLFGQVWSKNQNRQFKLKFGTKTKLNMQNSMMMLTLSVDHKYPSWANLVQKITIVSLSWKFVLRLIRIWKIQWWYLFFVFSTGSILLFWKFVSKIKIVWWSWNLESRLIRICRIRW